jgi:hypothetical protein
MKPFVVLRSPDRVTGPTEGLHLVPTALQNSFPRVFIFPFLLVDRLQEQMYS